MRNKLRVLWELIIGVPEGEEKQQEIGNLFGKNKKENFLNLVKEIDMQVQEAQRVPDQTNAKRPMPRHIKMPKVKDKERILKATKEKKFVTYRGVPIRLSDDFSKVTLQARHIQSHEKQRPIAKIALLSNCLLYTSDAADEVY